MTTARTITLLTLVVLAGIYSGAAGAAKCRPCGNVSMVAIYNQPDTEQVAFSLGNLDAHCKVFQVDPTPLYSFTVHNCKCIDVDPETGIGTTCEYSTTSGYDPDVVPDRLYADKGCDFDWPYTNPPSNCALRDSNGCERKPGVSINLPN